MDDDLMWRYHCPCGIRTNLFDLWATHECKFKSELKSGTSHVFVSGAKSSEQKPRYDLIPAKALEREAARMAEGAATHGERNYLKGKGDQAFIVDRINHVIEHALKYASGDRSTDHLAAIRCGAGMLIELE